ncbi:MAG: mannose-1-phosphate guanylyltransferase/mannose-6-phosphate isomerase [Alphaproteobacteria bacterium]|nr:mannose-1-phosphate guanylyltransferase/mannose-6-phosphate isomerase [Alphaproteobacteria bacterium]MCW5739293.1 mannose-1-phosphate guanylyltransferase/mannose-6-phosphate isomerase [Alphaproteobacteria bacterium]
MAQPDPTSSSHLIQPVILSGGSGTRLWPLSREAYPKQFLPLSGERSLLQQTVLRVADPQRFMPPVIVCNAEHRFLVAEQLRAVGVTPAAIVLEPAARNTAPAVAIGAMMATAGGPNRPLLVLPSDSLIRRPEAFQAAIAQATPAAVHGGFVTFGIAPTSPETGYGYIKIGAALPHAPGCHVVERFIEKPDLERARQFLADGGYAWNGGTFLLRADLYLGELGEFEPAIAEACVAAFRGATRDLDFIRLDAEAFGRSPSKSIDYAVMERTRRAVTVPVDMGWSDIGSWAALHEQSPQDAQGNALVGDVLAEDTRGSYVRAEHGVMVATLGVEDLIVVATGDVVMVTRRDRAQDVKKLVERVRASGRSEATIHTRVFRPWGYYETVDIGERHQVKHIQVLPGRSLSLQKHNKRAEHWVVVRGVARVTRGNDVFDLNENESTFIPLGIRHRLENTGSEPLHLIEVQSGSYLGEDDIERFEDKYGRA